MMSHFSIPTLTKWAPAIGLGLALGSCAYMAIEAQGYHTVTPGAAIVATNARVDSLSHRQGVAIAELRVHVDSLNTKVDVVLALLCANVTDRQLRFPNVRLECRATGQVP